jgi:hypothetical protein
VTDDFGKSLGTSKVLDASRRSLTLSGGAEERRLRRISNTPQGEAIEGNAADDTLMVDQGLANPSSEDYTSD